MEVGRMERWKEVGRLGEGVVGAGVSSPGRPVSSCGPTPSVWW